MKKLTNSIYFEINSRTKILFMNLTNGKIYELKGYFYNDLKRLAEGCEKSLIDEKLFAFLVKGGNIIDEHC